MFVFLSRVSLLTNIIRQFVLLHATKTYDRLIHTLPQYDSSKQRFSLADREFLRSIAQNVRQDRAISPASTRREHGSPAVEAKVDELVSQIAELTLMTRHNGAQPRSLDVREKRKLEPGTAARGGFPDLGGRKAVKLPYLLLLARKIALTVIALDMMNITFGRRKEQHHLRILRKGRPR